MKVRGLNNMTKRRWKRIMKRRRQVRRLSHWFWNDFMDMLPLLVLAGVIVVWIIAGITGWRG